MTPAPGGWGWRPGANLTPSLEDLPAPAVLLSLRYSERARRVLQALIDNPGLVEQITPLELFERYTGVLSRQQAYDVVQYARLGWMPPSRRCKVARKKPETAEPWALAA